jgi:hypothetical protein
MTLGDMTGTIALAKTLEKEQEPRQKEDVPKE